MLNSQKFASAHIVFIEDTCEVESSQSQRRDSLYLRVNGMKMPPPIEGMMDPVVARQKSAMDSLIGTCGDKRRMNEIIDDIYAKRTLGREVSL